MLLPNVQVSSLVREGSAFLNPADKIAGGGIEPPVELLMRQCWNHSSLPRKIAIAGFEPAIQPYEGRVMAPSPYCQKKT